MVIKGFSRTLLSFSLISSFSFTALTAEAASQCKGLEESTCLDNQACIWVSAYTTKNGNNVSAYCRASSGKAKKEVKKNKEEKGAKTGSNARPESTEKVEMMREERHG